MSPDMQLNRRSRFARDTKSDMEGSWVILGNRETYCDYLKVTLHVKMTFRYVCGFKLPRLHESTKLSDMFNIKKGKKSR